MLPLMNKLNRLCYACDLKDDPKLIAEYKAYHKSIWPEIEKSMKDAGIINMEIYLYENRLFMIMEVSESFDAEVKMKMDKGNSKVQEWESLMWNYQEALPSAKYGEKWLPAEQIFKL